MTTHTVILPDQPLLKAVNAPLELSKTIDKDLQNGLNETKEAAQAESANSSKE